MNILVDLSTIYEVSKKYIKTRGPCGKSIIWKMQLIGLCQTLNRKA